jgi:hypothetical protein
MNNAAAWYAKSLRGIEYNRPGRSTIARNQFEFYQAQADKTARGMVEAGQRDLVGLITEEHALKLRLSEARRLGTPRPELKLRLRSVRAAIKVAE